MPNSTLWRLFLLACMIIPLSTQAQVPPIYVGGGLTAGMNFHQMNIPVYMDGTLCGTFQSGNSILPNGFLTFEEPFGADPTGLWLAPRLHLMSSGADISTPAVDQANVRSPIDSSLVPVSRFHHLNSSLLSIGADLFVKYPLTHSLFIFGGPSLSYLLKRDAVQTEVITSPNYAFFSQAARAGSVPRQIQAVSSGQTRTLATGQIPNSNPFAAAITAGGSLDIQISRQVVLAPELSVAVPLTSIRKDLSWHVTTVALGVALKFNIAHEKQPEVVEVKPPPPPPPAPPKSEVHGSVQISGVRDSAGVEIETPSPQLRIEEFVRREAYPTLNYIFFDSASSVIPQRYHTLASPEDTQGFHASNFIGKNELDVYHDILNLVGKRLQASPSTTITLTGTNSNTGAEAGDLALSRARAAAVKQYLVSVWKIAPSRIAVQALDLPKNASSSATPEGSAENRRVEISASDPAFLDPLIVEQIDRTMNPPKLRLRTTATSNLPLAKDSLTLTQGTNVLARFSSSKPVQDWTPTMAELPRTDTPLVATLYLKDEQGTTVERHDSANVQQITIQRKREERVQDKIVEHYNLITFEFDKSAIDARSQRIIGEIAKNVTPKDKITLTGYTDLTGDRDHNLKLSETRAANVEAALKQAVQSRAPGVPFTASGEGPENLVDNRLPEGRFLSRTVLVKIERPVVD